MIPFAPKPGECYWTWTPDPVAKLEQHRRMIRERERLVREFVSVSKPVTQRRTQ